MKTIFKAVRFLLLPMERARGLRRDDNGQVIVLTAVMVFMAVIMGIMTTNTSLMLFNRVRAQNAVDAAADSFAAYQARGLNLSQHLNDLHFIANAVLMGLSILNWTVRILCPVAALRPPPVFFDYAFYRQCCSTLVDTGEGIDTVQNVVAQAILGAQSAINVIFPIVGALSANRLAQANGADPILQWLPELIGSILGAFGLNVGSVQSITDTISGFGANIPVYTFPLKPGQLISLNTEEKDPKPGYPPWDTMGIIQGLVVASDISCALAGSIASTSAPDHEWGWSDTQIISSSEQGDTYYCGGPSYNTWIAGKARHTVIPERLFTLAWLNPNMSTPEQEIGYHAFEDDYPEFRYRTGTDQFESAPFFAIASSQVGGSPLMETSFISNFEEYAKPELISVHIGEPGSDDLTRRLFIWH